MTIRYGFFNSVSKDRKYDADDFNYLLRKLISNGVFASPSNTLQVLSLIHILMYGTPKIKKDQQLYNAFRGSKMKKRIKEVQEVVIRRHLQISAKKGK